MAKKYNPIALDDFNRVLAYGLGGNWVSGMGDSKLENNQATVNPVYASVGTIRIYEHFHANQYARAKRGVDAADPAFSGILLRGGNVAPANLFQDLNDAYHIYVMNQGGDGQMYAQVDGSYYAIGSQWSSTALPVGHYVLGEIIGNEIQVYVDGVAQFGEPRTAGWHSDGRPGIIMWKGYGSDYPAVDDWEGGNIDSHYPLPSFKPSY